MGIGCRSYLRQIEALGDLYHPGQGRQLRVDAVDE